MIENKLLVDGYVHNCIFYRDLIEAQSAGIAVQYRPKNVKLGYHPDIYTPLLQNYRKNNYTKACVSVFALGKKNPGSTKKEVDRL